MNSKKMKDTLLTQIDKMDTVNLQNLFRNFSKKHSFLKSLFDSIAEGILIVGDDHRIQYFNPAAKEITGIPDGFVNLSIDRLLPALNWSLLLVHGAEGNARALRQQLELTYPQRRVVTVYALLMEMKIPTYALIVNDITETVDSVNERAETERGKLISMLAAEVAHEIGNPLNSLYLHLQYLQRLMKQNELNCFEIQEELQLSRNEVERLDSIITQFLKALRPGKPELKPLDLKELVLDSVHFIGRELEDRNISVEFYWEENVLPIAGDSGQLKQAMYNLLRNAMQAMPKGGKIVIKCTSDLDFIMLSVSDNGCGIAKDNIQKIFTPFFTTKSAGTGLGLMIVERIINDHGGSLMVDSRENTGTTFTISLPKVFKFPVPLPPAEEKNE